MFVIEILCRPHLVLPNTGADNSFTLGDVIQTLQYIMRLNEIAGPVVVERMVLFKIGNVCKPWRKIFLETTREVQEILETIAGIRYMRPGNLLYLSDLT